MLLLVTYVVFNVRYAGDGPTASTTLNVPRTALFSVFLIASSLTFWLSERNLRAGKQTESIWWLRVTILFGVTFLCGQAWEYTGLILDKTYIDSSLFASTFFTVTGFHAFHVSGGLVALSIVFALARRNHFTAAQSKPFGAIGVYWHFVDVQLKILTPVGSAINIVIAEKKMLAPVPSPTANMW